MRMRAFLLFFHLCIERNPDIKLRAFITADFIGDESADLFLLVAEPIGKRTRACEPV